MRTAVRFAAIVMTSVCSQPSLAQKLVDPETVAPEYRAAAEKRRAEQLKLNECAMKAKAANVLLRDRASYITKCAESSGEKSD